MFVVACSPVHLGGNEIAFVRDGHLWTVDPNGANAFEVVSDNASVIGYAWSPDHQIFAYRELDSHFASTPAGKNLQSNPITGLPGDLPTSLNTVSIDGGMSIPIINSGPGMQYSNSWWNASGNRLLYREESSHLKSVLPLAVSWYISQDDQPNGIARKSLPFTYSIPSFNPDSSSAIGNSQQGIFSITLSGTNAHQLTRGVLPGHPLLASLERVLWQPAHSHPLLLYAVIATPVPQLATDNAGMSTVQLMFNNGSSGTSRIATCYCTQFAWSPDGNSILYSVGATYNVYNINTHSLFSFNGEDSSVPYWSPNSRLIVLDGLHTLTLVNIASQMQQSLLGDNITDATRAAIPGSSALVQPLSNSLWAADSQHFLILTRGRFFWQGKKLTSGDGIYTVTVNNHGQAHGTPSVVDIGHDSQPGWSYEDPNTSFLFM
jgi:Tol biopolymer transport system component